MVDEKGRTRVLIDTRCRGEDDLAARLASKSRAIFQGVFQDSISQGAAAASAAMDKLSASVEQTDSKIGKAGGPHNLGIGIGTSNMETDSYDT